MAKFENSITHCLTECDHCTGAYTDDRNLILLNCRCNCHKYNDNLECEEINKQITTNHETVTKSHELSGEVKCSNKRIDSIKLFGVTA
jgi:hypothetical protein